MKTSRIPFSVPMFVSLIVATGSPLFLMLLGFVGLTGLDFFRFVIDTDYQQEVSDKPTLLAANVEAVVRREMQSLWAAVASQTFSAGDLRHPSLVSGVWTVDPGSREVRLITTENTICRRFTERENWIESLVGNNQGAAGSFAMAELNALCAGRTFARLEPLLIESASEPSLLLMETEVGTCMRRLH